jgi:phage gpG-like protein
MGVKVAGLQNVERRVRGMERRAQLVTPRVWQGIGSYLSNQVRLQFATSGVHFGTPWKPLTPRYALWKIGHGGANGILRFNGDLMRSFTRRPMSVEVYRAQSATYGSNDPKALWHQKGTHRNGKRVNPPRPMLVMTQEVRDEIRKRLAEYVYGRGEM